MGAGIVGAEVDAFRAGAFFSGQGRRLQFTVSGYGKMKEQVLRGAPHRGPERLPYKYNISREKTSKQAVRPQVLYALFFSGFPVV